MIKTIYYTIITCLFLCAHNVYAQQPAYTYYSIRDGLASNDTYNCVEDKKGFLWIATENGVSRFDGKNFKNYTTAQGLPDNDVLVIEMDSAGAIWVLPFQRTPAYYDEKTDKFINSKTDKALGEIKFGNVNNSSVLQNGGVAFWNNAGAFVYKNKEVLKLPQQRRIGYNNAVISFGNENYVTVSSDSLRLYKKDVLINKTLFNKLSIYTACKDNSFYYADSMKLCKIIILPDGSIGKKLEVKLPFEIKGMNFTGKQLAITSNSSNIYLADTATLEFSAQGFSFNALIRYIYNDKVGNTWICTKENGLIRYQQKGILTISDEAFQRNFNAISYWKNQLVVGTNNGEILLYKGPYDFKKIALYQEKKYSAWVKKISHTNRGLYISTEGAIFFVDNNLKKKDLFGTTKNFASKGFIVKNDTSIITGNSGAVRKINLNTLKYNDTINIRVTTLENGNKENIYVGSNTGLYKWEDYKKFIFLGEKSPTLTNRIRSLAYNAKDNILWTGLATDTLVALQNDNIIATIQLGAKLPGNECRALYSQQNGKVWVGTNSALARIMYTYENNVFQYTTTVFTTADGITGKQINDITEHNDTIYVATNAGVSIVPSKMKFDVPNIPVYITGISINNVDTALLKEFNLSHWQNNIAIRFNASDLGSTTDRIFEYRRNKEPWHVVNNDNISLQQLAPGSYTIQVRTLNRDGNPSNNIAEVKFEISTAFWKSFWFWALITLVLVALFFYAIQRRNKQKREEAVQKLLTEKKLSELELRALKAQINPHFVFNCLNSIKFLNHQKRFVETDTYLDKFSYLLRKTLDFSGLQKIPLAEELAYSKNYLELEKLRLGNKLNYNIITDANIIAEKTVVPPMLLQPYLENAIKHGIRHLPGEEGMVTIETKLENEHIICIIKDNGIGIENASAINKKINPTHISHGTNLQQRRADLYDVSIETISGKNGIGTTVILTLQKEQSI
jgi:ligand-binding sensor domain-containing protein/cbb3-type cytochrome oxidase subunit 3